MSERSAKSGARQGFPAPFAYKSTFRISLVHIQLPLHGINLFGWDWSVISIPFMT